MATPAANAAGLALITVSANPPTAATTGKVPNRSPYNCVNPQGSNRLGTSTASPPANNRRLSASS